MYKQIAKLLGYSERKGPVIGDLRDEMARDMIRTVEQVINNNPGRGVYYILIHAGNFGRNIRTAVMICDKQPPKLLGTICLKVDTAKGEIDRLWVLPYDVPRGDDDISDTGVEEIYASVRGIPLKY